MKSRLPTRASIRQPGAYFDEFVLADELLLTAEGALTGEVLADPRDVAALL
jgi:hypothetical protein